MSTGHGEKRSRRREIAISALLAHPTVKAAAKAAGISEATLHRWMRDPVFSSDYQRARERTLEVASEQLRHGSLAAVEVLREIATNRKAPSASRVQAARCFLECTNLLKGVGVALTVNNTIPTDLEGLTNVILESLHRMLASDRSMRESVRAMLVEIDRGENENGEATRPVLQ